MSGMDRVLEKKKGLKKRHLWIFVGVSLFLFVFYSIFYGDESSKLNVDFEKLSIEQVTFDIFQDYIAVQGTVEPIRTIYLDAVEGGRVEEVLREEGSMLKMGDPIIRLSNDNLVLDISNSEAQITRAINESRNARLSMQQQLLSSGIKIVELRKRAAQDKRDFRNKELLFAEQHISEEEFRRSKEDYNTTLELLNLYLQSYRNDSIYQAAYHSSQEESLERMSRNLKLTMKRLENLTINAPVGGELTSLKPEVGEVINYGTRVGTINILDSYKLKVQIDEHYIARIQRGLEGECEFSGQRYNAKISKIYPEVSGGRFTVDMVFTDSIPGQIRIGQTSRIRLQLGESNPALLLSRGGFYQSTGGQWVYVIDPSGEFAVKRQITLGRQNPRHYEVLEGLTEGEKVIVSGYENFGTADKLLIRD
jgi:HlyD family secretion protein